MEGKGEKGDLEIVLSNCGGVPIYEQIVTQIKKLILTGQLKEGDSLPSMRQLARELEISVITTKRAYEELERQGLITTMAGKGCFVAGVDPEALRERHRLEVEEHLQRAAEAAHAGDVPLVEMEEILRLLFSAQE